MAYTYSKIATYTVGSGGVASINFLNIPQNYTDLVLKLSARGVNGNGGAVFLSATVVFNSDSSGRSDRYLYNLNGSAASSLDSSSLLFGFGLTSNDATANTFANGEMYIPNYSGSNFKSLSQDGVAENNGTNVAQIMLAGLWANTSPINSISLTPTAGNFAQHSTAHLYGIKAEL